MSRELEERLRAALQARADQVTPDRLVPRERPPTRPARRPTRWVLPTTLAVAAAGIVAVVAGAVVAPRLLSSPVTPARTPTGTVLSPTTPPAPPTSPPTSRPPGQGGTPTGAASSAPPAAGTVGEFLGVRLPLPAGWRLATVSVGDEAIGCVLRPGAARPSDPRDCELVVRVVLGWPSGGHIIDPDSVGGFRDGSELGFADAETSCDGGTGRGVRPGGNSAVTVDGRVGQYRAVVVDCPAADPDDTTTDAKVEQWVFADHPGVAMIRFGRVAPDRQVEAIVTGADLPAGTGQRLADYGRLAGYRRTAAGVVVTFDRMVPASPWQPTGSNDNPQTYELRLTPGVVIRSAQFLCGGTTQAELDQANLGRRSCPLATMLQRMDDPDAVVDTTAVWVQYTVDGRVGYLVEEHPSG